MRLRMFAAAAGTAAALLVPMATAGQAAPPPDAIGYWTAERVQSAQPRDVVLDGARGPVAPRPQPDNPGNKPPKDGSGGDSGTPTDETTTTVTGASWEESAGPTVYLDDLVGKVLFTLGGTDYVCSASTILPSSGFDWIVMTAGHCVWDDAVGYATNWVFVPDFETVGSFGCNRKVEPYASGGACYAADSLHATSGWRNSGNSYRDDIAFANMGSVSPLTVPAEQIPTLVSASAIGVGVDAFGYPAAKKYSGSDLIYCRGTAVAGPRPYDANPGLACDMTGGSSGGPWYVESDGSLFATGLNSFGLRGYNGYMFSPDFGTGQASAALLAASNS